MKKIFYILLCFCVSVNFVFAEVITGKIDEYATNNKNKIIDSKTKHALSNAKISIPELNYTTYSDSDGTFRLNVDVNSKTVMFVEHEGYKVFSLTVDNNVLKNPLKLGIEKSNPFDLQISEGVIHLGDNMFSTNSANSGDFRLSAKGESFVKTFKTPNLSPSIEVIVKIGTVIGLDTKKAKEAGQNRIAKVYSSPMTVKVNGVKIGIIELNGDNKEFVVPKHILKETNELVITTGQNLFQTQYVDYDDCELANIRVETKEKRFWVKK